MNIILIPSRLASTRLPGKALADIHGKPTIQRVYEGCVGADGIDKIYVATPDKEIADVVEGFGGQFVMTGPHDTVLGRCAEASRILKPDVVVIVQGDEPMVNPHMISLSLGGLNSHYKRGTKIMSGISTLVTEIAEDEDINNPNMVKMILDHNDYLLYVTRAAVPVTTPEKHPVVMPTLYKQSSIMAFGHRSLEVFDTLPPADLELAEGIDMLRLMYYGHPIKVIVSPYVTQALDTAEDLERIRELWQAT
jgi:3-deoxy-manno-octulosonate cytidylyltransferase (CMP-KDO synthetase)